MVGSKSTHPPTSFFPFKFIPSFFFFFLQTTHSNTSPIHFPLNFDYYFYLSFSFSFLSFPNIYFLSPTFIFSSYYYYYTLFDSIILTNEFNSLEFSSLHLPTDLRFYLHHTKKNSTLFPLPTFREISVCFGFLLIHFNFNFIKTLNAYS